MKVGVTPAAVEKPAVAGREPARAALHLAQVGVRVYIHLQLAELQLAEGQQREHERTGSTRSCAT